MRVCVCVDLAYVQLYAHTAVAAESCCPTVPHVSFHSRAHTRAHTAARYDDMSAAYFFFAICASSDSSCSPKEAKNPFASVLCLAVESSGKYFSHKGKLRFAARQMGMTCEVPGAPKHNEATEPFVRVAAGILRYEVAIESGVHMMPGEMAQIGERRCVVSMAVSVAPPPDAPIKKAARHPLDGITKNAHVQPVWP